MTLVIGLVQASLPVYLSVGAFGVATTALGVSVARRRSAYREAEDLAAMSLDCMSLDSMTLDGMTLDGMPIDSEPFAPSNPEPVEDDDLFATSPTQLWPPTIASTPWSALEPVIELKAPGPGVLGRLRRRPLADLSARSPSLQALVDENPAPSSEPDGGSTSTPSHARSSPRSTNAAARKRPKSVSTQSRKGTEKAKTGRTAKTAATTTNPAKRARPATSTATK